MPIKQSTDIRYNAPKYLEERYNITKVSDAKDYLYPEGAIHYFTEDCEIDGIPYRAGMYVYNNGEWHLEGLPDHNVRIQEVKFTCGQMSKMKLFKDDKYNEYNYKRAHEEGICDSAGNIKREYVNTTEEGLTFPTKGELEYIAKHCTFVPGTHNGVRCLYVYNHESDIFLYYPYKRSGMADSFHLYSRTFFNGRLSNGEESEVFYLYVHVDAAGVARSLISHTMIPDSEVNLTPLRVSSIIMSDDDYMATMDLLDVDTKVVKNVSEGRDTDIPSVGAIKQYVGEGGGNSGGSGEGGGNTPPAGVKVEETEDAFILKGETPSDSQYYSKTEIDQKFEEFEPGSGEVSWDDITDKPTIPDEQVNADWNATSGKAQILNKPQFKSVGGYPILGEGNIPNEPNMHLIKQLTVESVCRGVQIDTDNDGNSFNLSQVIVFVNLIPGTDTTSRKFTINCNETNGYGWSGVGLGNDACGGTNKRFMSWWRVLGDRIMPVVSWASFNSTSMSNELTPVAKAADGCFAWGNRIRGQYHITSVQVGSGLYDHIGIGTEIEIYGC